LSERWIPAYGFAGRYEVSNLGRVRSVPRQVINGGRVRLEPGALLKPYWHRKHLKVTLYGDNRTERQVFVHILVLESFVCPKPKGMLGCHQDDDPRNNCLTNLRWDTPAANSRDAVRNGIHPESKRTTCDYGHPLDGVSRKGRYCRTCNRSKQRRSKALAALESRQSPGSGIQRPASAAGKHNRTTTEMRKCD
jgi:hypothetical protein